MKFLIEKSKTSKHAHFLLSEMEANGFAANLSGNWEIDSEDFFKLSAEEIQLLGLPKEACESVACHVTLEGIISRRGARLNWILKTEQGSYDRSMLRLPVLHTAKGEKLIPQDICRAIEALWICVGPRNPPPSQAGGAFV